MVEEGSGLFLEEDCGLPESVWLTGSSHLLGAALWLPLPESAEGSTEEEREDSFWTITISPDP